MRCLVFVVEIVDSSQRIATNGSWANHSRPTLFQNRAFSSLPISDDFGLDVLAEVSTQLIGGLRDCAGRLFA